MLGGIIGKILSLLGSGLSYTHSVVNAWMSFGLTAVNHIIASYINWDLTRDKYNYNKVQVTKRAPLEIYSTDPTHNS